ncbi:MAG: hypothetical protein AB7F35_23855 [Acetobacteraceae bacterium]
MSDRSPVRMPIATLAMLLVALIGMAAVPYNGIPLGQLKPFGGAAIGSALFRDVPLCTGHDDPQPGHDSDERSACVFCTTNTLPVVQPLVRPGLAVQQDAVTVTWSRIASRPARHLRAAAHLIRGPPHLS